jgi:adenosylhomocysteine nucleosidase
MTEPGGGFSTPQILSLSFERSLGSGPVYNNIRRIPQLLRIARDAQVAYVTLFRSRKLVAGTLGFTDFREFLLDVPAEDVLGGTLQV